jgi:glycosyltransferase involved in cell wall biosynthesis
MSVEKPHFAQLSDRFDISVILTLHNEGRYLRRTLRSLNESAVFARNGGISVELIVVLDNADEITIDIANSFDHRGYEKVQFLQVKNGSLGLSRNDGIAVAQGSYVATADGDDLVSYNILAEMYELANRLGDRSIIFPQFLFAFGIRYHSCQYYDLDAITPLAMLRGHPFISRIFGSTKIFRKVKYSDARLSEGYAYEDWHFNCEAVAAGCNLCVAKNTILFYRQRPESLLAKAEAISIRQIPPSNLFTPQLYVPLTQSGYDRLIKRGSLGPELQTHGPEIVADPLIRELIIAANRIEPGIDPDLIARGKFHSAIAWCDYPTALAYHEICRLLGNGNFSDVFILPFMARGGADRFIIDVITELDRSCVDSKALIVFGERVVEHIWLEKLPHSATVIDLANEWPSMDESAIDAIALKLIQSCCASDVRIHVRQSAFGERFVSKFRGVLKTYRVYFYRFCDVRRYDRGDCIVEPWGFQFVSENLPWLHRIVSDNKHLIENDCDRIGTNQEKWACLYPRQSRTLNSPLRSGTLGHSAPKALWASRLDFQKRPMILSKIAAHLRRLGSPISIHAYGVNVLEGPNAKIFENADSLVYQGAYSNFFDIARGEYFSFLYTSYFDGVPNVLLEAASIGLPIVAPNVGGIGEFVTDDYSGILLESLYDDEAMAKAYAESLVRLWADEPLRSRLAQGALEHLAANHSDDAYASSAAKIFGL